MKNFILIFCVLSAIVSKTNAQEVEYDIIGSEAYGRIFDLTYDENIENRIYAITLGNHILKSDDNGNNWEVIFSLENGTIDGLKYLKGHNSLSFFTKNVSRTSLKIFDLTTESIIKQYQFPYQQANFEWVDDYQILSSDTDVAVAIQGYKIGVESFQVVYYTENGGTDWEEIYNKERHDNVSVNSVSMDPRNSQKILMGRGVGSQGVNGGLWISENGGQHWIEKLPGITFKPITFHPENSNEIWIGSSLSGSSGQEESLYKSIDGGETWDLIPIEWSDYLQDCINVIGINPYRPEHIVVLEENEILVSYDEGQTWEVFVYPGYDEIYEYSYGLNISFNPFDESELWVSANYFPMFSANSGESLSHQETPYFVGEGNTKYIDNGTESHLYYGVQSGYIHRDLQTMEERDYDLLPLNYVTNNIPVTIYPDSNIPGRIFTYSGGFMGKEFKVSNNHGEDRVFLYSDFANQCTAVAFHPDSPDKVWAVFATFSDNVIIKEIDFSDLQNPVVTAINPPRNSTDIFNIYFDSDNSQHVLLSQGGVMYRSLDGGNEWEEITNGLEALDPDSDIIMKLIVNPFNEDQLTIATSKGIFTTFDKGEEWRQLSNKPAHNIKYSNIVDGSIIAVVHNSDVSNFGVFYSFDNGQSWEDINLEDLLHVKTGHVLAASDINFEQDMAHIYISSVGLGLIRYSLNLESLGIEDIEIISKESLTIYPNPTTDFFSIKNSSHFKNYEIFDVKGRKVLMGETFKKINVSSLKAGAYFIRISTETNSIRLGKFIKQ
ncbi:MAG TPA: T9SS type A sorting domain-containing protein [Aequorivita sp.]|nr:T9SS type A sorting domain-containing protein [Aequorivita sp.]